MLQYFQWCGSLSGRVWRDECGDVVGNKTKRKETDESQLSLGGRF